MRHAIFLMFNGIFSISATSCSLVIRWAYQYCILAVEMKNLEKLTLLSFNRTAVFLYNVDLMVSENDNLEAR